MLLQQADGRKNCYPVEDIPFFRSRKSTSGNFTRKRCSSWFVVTATFGGF